MTFGRVLAVLALIVLGVYLSVTAPPPLPETAATAPKGATVDALRMFQTLNAVNAQTRKLYTERIVGAGGLAGLQFGEDWKKEGVEAGPLPALFLRLVAEKLQQKKPVLGLFLGSDKPINPSNLFTGQQAAEFAEIRATGKPRFFSMPDGSRVAMFPDIAAATPCITCHNKHKSTPKKDWKLNDIMGAVTWVHQADAISMDEYRLLLGNLYAAIEESYSDYLRKVATFKNPPSIGTEWPAKGKRALPDSKTMMETVYAATSNVALAELLRNETAPKQETPR
jgi:adenylate cyclase